jgi:glutamate-1-semialdehyde 2,1-aminomutase
MFTLFFTRSAVTDYATAMTADRKTYGRYFHGMLERGVYLPPAQFEAAFLSYAHMAADLDATAAAARQALRAL